MEKQNKVQYEAPVTEVVEVKLEGFICQSQTNDIPGWGNAFEI